MDNFAVLSSKNNGHQRLEWDRKSNISLILKLTDANEIAQLEIILMFSKCENNFHFE